MKTTVTARRQTVVPAKIRKDHQISAQTQLEWLDDGETIRVIPLPSDAIRAARGISTGLRQRLLAEREWERQCVIDVCAISLMELAYITEREQGEDEAARLVALVKAWPITWVYPDEKTLLQAAKLKATRPPTTT